MTAQIHKKRTTHLVIGLDLAISAQDRRECIADERNLVRLFPDVANAAVDELADLRARKALVGLAAAKPDELVPATRETSLERGTLARRRRVLPIGDGRRGESVLELQCKRRGGLERAKELGSAGVEEDAGVLLTGARDRDDPAEVELAALQQERGRGALAGRVDKGRAVGCQSKRGTHASLSRSIKRSMAWMYISTGAFTTPPAPRWTPDFVPNDGRSDEKLTLACWATWSVASRATTLRPWVEQSTAAESSQRQPTSAQMICS